jgi:hypothetical protein
MTAFSNIKTTNPPTDAEIECGIVDYAESLTVLAKHSHVLEQALPLNNVEQIEESFKAVEGAVLNIRAFLTGRGFNV